VTAAAHDLVEDLNRLMAEEAEACLRYFQIRFRLHGAGQRVAEQFFEEAATETMEHAQAIARQIRALDHVPTLHINLSLGGGAVTAEEALSEALDVEQQALDAYKDFLPRVSDQPPLEDFIRRQIDTETEHVQAIKSMVKALKTMVRSERSLTRVK